MTDIDHVGGLPEDLAPALALLCGYPKVALAVSGGRDSMALMVLAAAAGRALAGFPEAVVLTVDHGLRPGSAGECGKVAEWAARYGFQCRVLQWTGDKPASGIQAAARAARYRLMAAAAREEGAAAIVTAHHLEDQAETFLMRLARGSGVNGLAAMAQVATVEGLALLRPLLSVRRSRLEDVLAAAGQHWIEDPSNASPRYERARIRAAAPQLAELGLVPERIARAARSLGRARAALEHYAGRFIDEAVEPFPQGFVALDRDRLAVEPAEVALRVLSRLVEAVAGAAYGPELGKLERLLDAVCGAEGEGPGGLGTLGGAAFELRAGRVWIYREAGRRGLPDIAVPADRPVVWDGRFAVRVAAADTQARVRALGRDGRLAFQAQFPEDVPRRAIETVPALVLGGEIRGIPASVHEPPGKDLGGSILHHLDPLMHG